MLKSHSRISTIKPQGYSPHPRLSVRVCLNHLVCHWFSNVTISHQSPDISQDHSFPDLDCRLLSLARNLFLLARQPPTTWPGPVTVRVAGALAWHVGDERL